MKYFQHKEVPHAICQLVNRNTTRWGKWVWVSNNTICTEVYTFKAVDDEFFNKFNEITERDFNNVWGSLLEREKPPRT